jgi:iron complex outermembrane receptor protein
VLTAAGALRTMAGVQVSNRQLVGLSFEGDNLLEPNSTDAVGGFLFEELAISKGLRVQAAGRIEHDEVSGATLDNFTAPTGLVARDLSFDPKSASLGLLYDLPLGIVASLSGQFVERAPVAQELFSKGAHDATGTFEIGDPEIGIEKARTVELGFKKVDGPLRFDTSAYYTQFDGFIFRQLTGGTCDTTLASCIPGPGLELKQVVFDQRDATFYGVELAGEYDVAPVWNGVWGVSGRYDFVRAQFSDGENVPRMPPHRLGGGLYYRDRGWQARLAMLHAFRQDEISANETPTSSYTLLDAEVSYTMTAEVNGHVTPTMTVGLKGENLLDDDVRNSASFKKDEVLLPGANVRLFGNLTF